MPIPKPSKNESKDEFIARCMENPVMVNEFPNTPQRFAVCSSQWKRRDKKEKK